MNRRTVMITLIVVLVAAGGYYLTYLQRVGKTTELLEAMMSGDHKDGAEAMTQLGRRGVRLYRQLIVLAPSQYPETAWRSAVLTVAVLALLAGVVLTFQRVTGAAISAHAVERSRTFVDYTRDVQAVSRILNYGTALEAIAQHPILGNGQGKTLTCYSFDPDLGRYQRWTSWSLDSLYLTLWLKMGLPGLLAFTWLCLQVLRLALRTMRRAVTRETRAFAGGAVAVMESPEARSPFHQ